MVHQQTPASNSQALIETRQYRLFQIWKLSGEMPSTSPHPLYCAHCSSWATHRVFAIDDRAMTTCCPENHQIVAAIPYPRFISANAALGIFNKELQPVTLADYRKSAAKHPAIEILSQHRYNHIPKGYEAPEDSFHPALYVQSFHGINPIVQNRIDLMTKCWVRQAPNYQWVSADLFDAVKGSSLSPHGEFRFRWPHAVFFLPPDSLVSPQGAHCPWIAFAYVGSGVHQIPNGKVYLHDQHLLVWTIAPETTEAFSADFPCSLDLEKTHVGIAQQPDCPVEVAFIRNMLRLVMLLNITALHNPHFVIDPIGKRGKVKRKNHQPITWYTAPIFGLPKRDNGHPSGPSNSPANRRGYWTPGWVQRYRKGKKTDWSYVQHWRPPQYIDGQEEIL